MHRVFVYGTLKRGAGKNDLLKAAVFAGKAITVSRFRMLDGPYPVLRDNGPGAYRVAGEVYEVDEPTLQALDDYEGVDERLYDRIEIDVKIANEAQVTRAFVYIGCADHWDRQPNPLYATLDDHGHLDWTSPQTRAGKTAP